MNLIYKIRQRVYFDVRITFYANFVYNFAIF